MKLGIVVVYLVSEGNEKLLDLHLSQIEKHTQIPYTIYGSVNRLLPKFRQRLEQHVKICECPTTDLRGSEEHAFYLDQLVRIAIEDGASHVASLHVDSFPVCSGWIEKLTGKLSESCVLAAIMREENYDRKPHSAFLLFHRDFYLKYRPTFRLSEDVLSSPRYKQYLQEFEHIADSGVGYGFRVYSEGLSWYPLLRSNKAEDHHLLGGVHGDLVFHLGAATRNKKLFQEDIWRTTMRVGILKKFSLLLPQRVKTVISRCLGYFLEPAYGVKQGAFERVRKQLLEDPESYLKYLRTGER